MEKGELVDPDCGKRRNKSNWVESGHGGEVVPDVVKLLPVTVAYCWV